VCRDRVTLLLQTRIEPEGSKMEQRNYHVETDTSENSKQAKAGLKNCGGEKGAPIPQARTGSQDAHRKTKGSKGKSRKTSEGIKNHKQ